MRRLYRIYYSVFSDEKHREVISEIKKQFGVEVVDHPSRVHPDFRFIEVYLNEPGHEEELSGLVRLKAGTMHVKVDWIDTTR